MINPETASIGGVPVRDVVAGTRRRTDTARPPRSRMDNAIAAIQGCIADLKLYAGDAGMSFLVADRLERLAGELATFKARDLLNSRTIDDGVSS